MLGMVKYFSEVVGMPVVGQHRDGTISAVKDIVVDHERGSVLAVKVLRWNKYISWIDILSWNGHVSVADDSVLVDLDDLVRTKEVVEQKIGFTGKRVMTQGGEFVGFLHNFSFDTSSGRLKSIVVSKIFLFWKYATKNIAAQEIVEVTNKAVVIKDLVKSNPVQVKSGLNLEAVS